METIRQRCSTDRIDRRRLFLAGGGLLGATVVAACSGGSDEAASTDSTVGDGTGTGTRRKGDSSAASGSSTTVATSELSSGTPPDTVFTAADFDDLRVCRLLPELTAGPFPTKVQMERRDITEGHDGEPLRVGILVVDESCKPVASARVEIWHCDVDGDYSSYTDGATNDDDGEGTTFLRGNQVTNDEGIVEFVTIWPGWYRGRAIHIHSAIHVDDSTVLTTQYLFDDDLNAEVMASGPYAAYGQPDTTNAQDGVTRGAAERDGLLFTVADDTALDGRRALIVVGVAASD